MIDGGTGIINTEQYLRYVASVDPRCTFEETEGILWFDTKAPQPPFEGITSLENYGSVYAPKLQTIYSLQALSNEFWEQ